MPLSSVPFSLMHLSLEGGGREKDRERELGLKQVSRGKASIFIFPVIRYNAAFTWRRKCGRRSGERAARREEVCVNANLVRIYEYCVSLIQSQSEFGLHRPSVGL